MKIEIIRNYVMWELQPPFIAHLGRYAHVLFIYYPNEDDIAITFTS